VRFEHLVFVTSNVGKLREAEAVLGTPLEHHALDLDELQSLDLEEVVRHKAAAAFERLGRPVLVEDTGLGLAGLGGFPGPLVKFLLACVGPEGICALARCFGDDAATARCVACATNGERTVLGVGAVPGRIATAPRGRLGFGWDSVFVPDAGDGRTYAEMDENHKNAISHRRLALADLRRTLGP